MEGNSIEVGEFLFEQIANFRDVTEYGISLSEVLSGSISPPAAGAATEWRRLGAGDILQCLCSNRSTHAIWPVSAVPLNATQASFRIA